MVGFASLAGLENWALEPRKPVSPIHLSGCGVLCPPVLCEGGKTGEVEGQGLVVMPVQAAVAGARSLCCREVLVLAPVLEKKKQIRDNSYVGIGVLITAFERLIEVDLAVRKGFILAVQ